MGDDGNGEYICKKEMDGVLFEECLSIVGLTWAEGWIQFVLPSAAVLDLFQKDGLFSAGRMKWGPDDSRSCRRHSTTKPHEIWWGEGAKPKPFSLDDSRILPNGENATGPHALKFHRT